MTYESKWKPIIDKEWDEKRKKWEEQFPGEKMLETCFHFMNTFLQNKYNLEPDDIKNQVRKHREAMKEEGPEDKEDEETNQTYQK